MEQKFVTKKWVTRFTIGTISMLAVLSVALFVVNLVANIQLNERVDLIQEILTDAQEVSLHYGI